MRSVVGVFLLLGLVLTGCSSKEDTKSGPADLDSFYAQKLKWSECEEAKCSTVEVPIDYESPEEGTVTLQVRVIPATGKGGKHLFINPGGPGGSVIGGFEDYMADALSKDVRELYDVVAVDPRGVGSSEPLDCLSDEDLYALYADDQTPDDQGEQAKFDKQWKEFGSQCRAESGDLAGHMTTEETARDFDIVRDALKAKTFDWFGYSYGARLGATYATLFPGKVGRMVLDGAEDPSLGMTEALLTQSKGFEVALRAYVEDCVKQESCPLGSEPDAAIRKVISLLESLDTEPLKTSDADRPLTQGMAEWGLGYPLYDEASWPDLSKALTAAFKGDGTPLRALGDDYLYYLEDGTFADNGMEAFPLISCLDADSRVTAEEALGHAEQFAKESPVFGKGMAWSLAWCGGIPMTDHPQIDIDAHESAPIVVLGTTRDPATPYEQSIALAKQLGSAVFVTREGDGHTAYDMGNGCIDKLVDTYLARGTVPKDKTVCNE
jgi:pimeloyl-ACP methyl ester carboxylesterase